jgi:hypothetical protein
MGTQLGTTIGTEGIQLSGETWTLNQVARECVQNYIVPFPDILEVLDYEFPIGKVANNSYPLVKLTQRQLTQRKRGNGNPDLAELILKFEQTEPDEHEEPPEDTLVEYGNTQETSLSEHPETQEPFGELFNWFDHYGTQKIHSGKTAEMLDIPQEIRGVANYLVATRQVVRTEYSASKYSTLNINVTEDPPGSYGESGNWRVTSGSTGNSGRWYVRTRTYTFKPNGWPPEIYDSD